MKTKKKFYYVICIILMMFVFADFTQAADYKALGQTAEGEGKIRQALIQYLKALPTVSVGSSEDIQLREKIIKLAQKLQPPPVIPEAANRYMARGEAFAEVAKDKDGFKRAAKEFQAAVEVAPWMADAYYNLGILQDKAGLYKQAIQSLKFYLLVAPNASDTREIQNLIYKIEARQEDNQRAASGEMEEEKKQTGIEALTGIWRGMGPDGYNERFHLRAEVAGSDLLWINVWDIPYPGMKVRPGKESLSYRMSQKESGFVCSKAKYDPVLATQEIGIEVSKDYKTVTFTEWHKEISPPKLTFTWHKVSK